MLTRLPSARGLEWNTSHNRHNFQTRTRCISANDVAKAPTKGMPSSYAPFHFALIAHADLQAILMIAEVHLPARYASKQTAVNQCSPVVDGDTDGTPSNTPF